VPLVAQSGDAAAGAGRAGFTERGADALAESCEPLDGLIGVDEAHLAGATVSPHAVIARGGDLVLGQRSEEVRRGRARRLGVEQQRPAPMC
jgi:hypothetical protein